MGMYNAHHRRRAAQPARDLQGAAQPERAVGGDAAGHRRRGGRRRAVAAGRRDDVPAGHGRGHRADAGAAGLAVQDVRRRAADQRRLRARRRRHPVPAGAEGPLSRVRPRRGAAEQRASARRCAAGTARRVLYDGARCRTSTRSTKVSPSTRWSPTGSGRRWAWTRQHAARRAVGRGVRRPVRLGLRDLGLGAALAPRRRLRRRRGLAAGPGVLPGRRLDDQRGIASPARSSGRGSTSPPAPCTSTSAAAASWRCPRRRPSGARRPRTRSGRSPTSCTTASIRDQFMARHKANHVQVVYAPTPPDAEGRSIAKAALFDRLGVARAPVRRRRRLSRPLRPVCGSTGLRVYGLTGLRVYGSTGLRVYGSPGRRSSVAGYEGCAPARPTEKAATRTA